MNRKHKLVGRRQWKVSSFRRRALDSLAAIEALEREGDIFNDAEPYVDAVMTDVLLDLRVGVERQLAAVVGKPFGAKSDTTIKSPDPHDVFNPMWFTCETRQLIGRHSWSLPWLRRRALDSLNVIEMLEKKADEDDADVAYAYRDAVMADVLLDLQTGIDLQLARIRGGADSDRRTAVLNELRGVGRRRQNERGASTGLEPPAATLRGSSVGYLGAPRQKWIANRRLEK